VAAACSSSTPPLGFQNRPSSSPEASTSSPIASSQNERPQFSSKELWTPGKEDGLVSQPFDVAVAGRKKSVEDPNRWANYKRRQFLEWLYSQPDAHDDIWGYSSAGCTPVCLSRCSSVVDVTINAMLGDNVDQDPKMQEK
jgi:hypothetical protein